MRKFLILVFLLILNSIAYGATSDDTSVYVRQDVFDAKMEALFVRLHSEIETLGNKINSRIDALSAEMNGKIDGNFRELSARIDGVEKRMDTTNTFLYYLLVLFSALLILPIVNKLWESRTIKQQPSVTIEDVKRLIAEAKLNV